MEFLMNSNFSVIQVISLVTVTLAGVICSVSFNSPLVIGFLPGFFVLVLLAYKRRIPVKQIVKISLNGVKKTRIVILILFFVSFLLPSWYLSGTIGQMVKVALHFMVPSHFFVLAFIVSMIFSMLLGTSLGTLSSIGIPIMGSAVALHLPVEIAAGALVSGAFVGDRTSPFSSSHQLLSNTLEIPVKKQFQAMFVTSIAAIILCLLLYGGMDYYISGKTNTNVKPLVLGGLSLVKFIPPLVLLLFVIFRLSIVYAFLSSILSAALLALIGGTPFLKMTVTFWTGASGLGGGLAHMYELLLFLALAGAYNGLLEELNVIQPYLDQWLKSSRSLIGDTVKIILATFLISLIAANQTLPIILTGRSFLPHWSRKYGNSELARVMGDSTMLFPGMVPWSVLAIMCSTIVGIPLFRYLPYALFIVLLPILTIFISVYKQVYKSKMNKSAAA
jgi:NhaC family Na+:H+ antiporter